MWTTVSPSTINVQRGGIGFDHFGKDSDGRRLASGLPARR